MKCFNWKVIGGLAVVGVGLYIVAPDQVLVALPFLLLAACPLSMLFMMRSMQGGQCAQPGQPATPRPAHVPQSVGIDASLTHDEQLAQLRAQLESLDEQQAALARQVEGLQAVEGPAPPNAVIEEAEQVASAAVNRREPKP